MFIAAAALAVVSIPAFARQPAPTSAGSARIYTEMPEACRGKQLWHAESL
jgi:hypothetical protein